MKKQRTSSGTPGNDDPAGSECEEHGDEPAFVLNMDDLESAMTTVKAARLCVC